MYSQIIKNDWKNLIGDRSVWLVAVGLAVLLGYAIYNGAKWSGAQSQLHQTLVQEQQQRLTEARDRLTRGETTSQPGQPDPSDAYAIGASLAYAVLPSSPLSFTSIGQSDLLRPTVGVSVLSKQRTVADKQGFENPLVLLAGRFDLAFVIIYLLPLVVLAFSFNLLSAERENGTLQLVLSQPVSLARFGVAKLLHRFAIVFLFVSAVSLIGMVLSTPNLSSSTFWVSALMWLVAVFSYTLFWFALALLVNSFGHSSATNAVALGGCWILLILVLPSLLNAAVTSIYPMPSRVEEINAIRSVNLDMRRDGARLVSEFYQDHPELAPRSDVSDKSLTLAYVTIQQDLKRRLATVEDRFNAQLERQQRTVERTRFVSPAIAMQEILNQIAGTDTSRYQLFRAQARAYAESWDAVFLPAIYRNVKLAPEDYDSIPRFTFYPQTPAKFMAGIGVGFASILALTSVLFVFAGLRLKRGRLLDQRDRLLSFTIIRANRAGSTKTQVSKV